MNFVTCDHDLDTVIESANKQLFYHILDQIFAHLLICLFWAFLGYSEQHLQKSFT